MLFNPLMTDKSQCEPKNLEDVSLQVPATGIQPNEKGVVSCDADSHDRETPKSPNLSVVFRFICLTNLWTILLTFIPVGVDIPPNNYYKVS